MQMGVRNWLGLSALGIIVSLPVLAQRANEPKRTALQVLEAKVKAEGDVTLSGEREIESLRRGRSRVVRQKIVRDSGGRYHIETLSPPSHKGALVVCDGATRWRYDPRARIAFREILPLRAEEKGRRLREIRELQSQIAFTLGDGGLVAGRPTWLVKISARQSNALLRQYWIDREKWVELKKERYWSDGTPSQRERFVSITYSPTLTASIFDWRAPAGVVVKRVPGPLQELPLHRAHDAVGFAIFVPPSAVLPTGFKLLSDRVAVFEEEGAKVAWLRFGNGIDVFSLFQRRRPNRPINLHHTATTSEWIAGPLHFTLVGQLRPEQIGPIRAVTVRALGTRGHSRGTTP